MCFKGTLELLELSSQITISRKWRTIAMPACLYSVKITWHSKGKLHKRKNEKENRKRGTTFHERNCARHQEDNHPADEIVNTQTRCWCRFWRADYVVYNRGTAVLLFSVRRGNWKVLGEINAQVTGFLSCFCRIYWQVMGFQADFNWSRCIATVDRTLPITRRLHGDECPRKLV